MHRETRKKKGGYPPPNPPPPTKIRYPRRLNATYYPSVLSLAAFFFTYDLAPFARLLDQPASPTYPGEALLRVLGAQRVRQRGRREDVQVEGELPHAQRHACHGARRPSVPVSRGVVAVPNDARVLNQVPRGRKKHGSAAGQAEGARDDSAGVGRVLAVYSGRKAVRWWRRNTCVQACSGLSLFVPLTPFSACFLAVSARCRWH